MFVTKGSSRGATLSFTLRSKGEGGQPRYLILQEIASHFSTPPPRGGGKTRTMWRGAFFAKIYPTLRKTK